MIPDAAPPAAAPHSAPAPTGAAARPLWPAVAAAVALVLARGACWVVFGDADFDSDQAIVGLMAKHIAEGRAFPLFFYGQHYLLGVEAWLAAPVFLVAPLSIPALKAVVLALNAVAGALLVRELVRTSGLSPTAAVTASLFVLLPPPISSALLGRANGANVEPLVAILLLWVTRRHPLVFGVVLAVGTLCREFTLYGLGALIVVEGLSGDLLRRGSLQSKALSALAFGGTWEAVRALTPYASFLGPGTVFTGEPVGNFEQVSRFASLRPTTWLDGLWQLMTQRLPDLLGVRSQPLAPVVALPGRQGVDGVWVLLAGALLGMAVLAGWRLARHRARRREASVQFPAFLLITGLLSLLVYLGARGDAMSIGTMRYILVGLFLPVGIVSLFLVLEPRARLRRLALAAVLAAASVPAIDTFRLAATLVASPPSLPQRALAEHLVGRGVRFGRAGYWTAYVVTFLADERVKVTSGDYVRIGEYRMLYRAHPHGRADIRSEPCTGCTTAGGAWVWVEP